jgi:hypothetical protein
MGLSGECKNFEFPMHLNSNTFQSGRFYNGKIRHIQTLQPKIEAWFDIQIEKQSNLSIKAYFIETAKDIYSVKGAFQDFFYRATLQSNQKESIRHHQKAISLENFQENGIMAGSKYVSLPPNSTNDLACNPTENPIGMLGVHFNNKSFNGINSVSIYLRTSAEKFRESAINKEGFELATQGHLSDGKLLFLYALLANQVNRIELFGSRHTLTSSIFQFQEVLIERLMLNAHTTIENMLLENYFQKLKDNTENANFRDIGTNLETIEDIPNTNSKCYPHQVAKNDYLGKHWITTLTELNHARMDYKTFRLEMQFKAKERLAHFNQNSHKSKSEEKSEANEIDQDLSIQNQNVLSPASMSSSSLDGQLKSKNNLPINDDFNPIVDHSMQSDDDSIRSIDQDILELALLCYRLNSTFNDLFPLEEASQDPCIKCFKKYLSQLEILFGNGNNRAALHNDEDINGKAAVEPKQAMENDDSADDNHLIAKNVITINKLNSKKIEAFTKNFQNETFTLITVLKINSKYGFGQSSLHLKFDKNRIFTITELEEYHQELHKLEKLLKDSEINDFDQYVENELSKVEDLLEHINITDKESLAYKQLKASNQTIDQHNKVMGIQLHQLSMQYNGANEKIEALKHEKQKLQQAINNYEKIQHVIDEDYQTAGCQFTEVEKQLKARDQIISELTENVSEIRQQGKNFVKALLCELDKLQKNAKEAQLKANKLIGSPNKDDFELDDITSARQCKAILDNYIMQSNAIIKVIKQHSQDFLESNNKTLQKLEGNVERLKQLTEKLEIYINFIQQKLQSVLAENKLLKQQLEQQNAETIQQQQLIMQEDAILNKTITIKQFKDTVNKEYYSTLGCIIHVILCICIVGFFIPRERSNTMKALKEIMDSKKPGANVSFGEIYDAMGGKDAISSRYKFFNPRNDKSDAPGTHKTDQTLAALKLKFISD